MSGSPKKRAKREAARRAKELSAQAVTSTPESSTSLVATAPGVNLPATIPVVEGELLTPVSPGVEPTRTALKRAMRARAQEHAEEAIGVLVENMRDKQLNAERRESAANKLLEWGFGKPAQEIEAGEGAQMIVIRRFSGDET